MDIDCRSPRIDDGKNPLSEIFRHVDIFREILSRLDACTICKTICSVCHYWNITCKHDRLWDEFILKDFGSFFNKEFISKFSTSYSMYNFLFTSFSWNTSVVPTEITYEKNADHLAFSLARKKSNSPDISYAIGKNGFSKSNVSSTISWSIRIICKGSEMRIGFTTNPGLIYSRHTLSEPEIWIWSDGGRIYSAAQALGKTVCYRKTNTAGVELDFEENCCNFYKNGKFSGKLPNLPEGPLFPLVALDAHGDFVEITMGIKNY